MNIVLILSFFFYCVSSIGYMYYLKKNKDIIQKISLNSAFIGFILHLTYFIYRWVVGGFFPVSNFFESLSFFALLTVIFYLLLETSYKLKIFGSFILPIVFLITGIVLNIHSHPESLNPALKSPWLFIHTMLCFISYAGFIQTFGLGVMYLLQERQLKRKKSNQIYHRLPSLQVLDHVGYNMLRFGFIFLTLGIVSGSIWAKDAWGSYWNWDPKEVWTLITWLIYATVLHARAISGWRGKKAAYLAIVGFISLLFTFLGVSFLFGGLHAYI